MNGPSLVEFLQRFRAQGDQRAYVHRRGYRTERWSCCDIYNRALKFANGRSRSGINRWMIRSLSSPKAIRVAVTYRSADRKCGPISSRAGTEEIAARLQKLVADL